MQLFSIFFKFFVDIDIQMKILEQNPEISEDQLDQILSFQEKFSTPFVIVTVLIIFSLISGFFSSLVLGLIFKKSSKRSS